ncbi:hypothetical protein [Micrococcus porci]|uniref:hypothetical protein n=1 Tax=Micrococcus porci TaxID=2856555 RepID=UPI003CF08415
MHQGHGSRGGAAWELAGMTFTEPELRLLAARGTLEAVLPGVYRPVDVPSDPAGRAAALGLLGGPVLAAGWTAVGPSAAWVHVGGPAPHRLHAAVPHFHRLPAGGAAPAWRLVQSDVAAGPTGAAPAEEDVQVLEGVRVTVPARTVEDLLLTGDPDDARRAARVIAAHGAEGLRDRLDRPSRRPGSVGARRRLRMLLDALGADG